MALYLHMQQIHLGLLYFHHSCLRINFTPFLSSSGLYLSSILGVHFPGDVLGGMLLGLLIGYGVYRLTKWGISKYKLSDIELRQKLKSIDYRSVWWIIGVASAEVLTICLVVKKLLKYGLF